MEIKFSIKNLFGLFILSLGESKKLLIVKGEVKSYYLKIRKISVDGVNAIEEDFSCKRVTKVRKKPSAENGRFLIF